MTSHILPRAATAHQFWDRHWTTDNGRADWSDADPFVVEWIDLACADGAKRGIDIGCGVGRHTLAMARAGLSATGIDMSPAGLSALDLAARAEGFTIETREASIHALPFADESFDFALSFNVIYHGMRADVAKAIAEIARILPVGGLFQGTLLSKRNANYGIGTEIDPDTFVADASDGSDKDHPHFYCDAAGVVKLLDGFELITLFDLEQRRQGAWHWHFVAERR